MAPMGHETRPEVDQAIAGPTTIHAAHPSAGLTQELFDVLFGESSDLVLATRLDDGVIVAANERIARTFGLRLDEVIGRTSVVLRSWTDPSLRAEMLEAVRTSGFVGSRTARFQRAAGDDLWLDVSMKRIRFCGEVVALSIARDVTARVEAEAALRESEARHRAVVESMAEGIVVQDMDGAILSSNDAAERILGLSAHQMTGRSSVDELWRAVHEDGSPWPGETHPAMVTIATGEPVTAAVMGVHKPSGELTWISINSWPIHQPGIEEMTGVVCSVTDITPLRESEQARMQLTAEMFRAEQAERERIAGELHDDTVQVLAATLISLDRARNSLAASDPETLAKTLDMARSTLGAALERTRRLMFELRPPLLETGGIAAAVRDLAEQTAAEVGLALTLTLDVRRHDPHTEAIVYATIREALANVRRHAHAANLRIGIQDDAELVDVEIVDDGVGFDPATTLDERQRFHLGLATMRERVRLAGGHLEIRSQPGHGTRLTFRIPTRPPD